MQPSNLSTLLTNHVGGGGLPKLLELRLKVKVLPGELCDVWMMADHVLQLLNLLAEKFLKRKKKRERIPKH